MTPTASPRPESMTALVDSAPATEASRLARFVPFLKTIGDVSIDDVWDFMRNVRVETQIAQYPPEVTRHILDLVRGAGRLDQERYYKCTMCEPMVRAIRHIFRRFERPRIMDIACGTGTQALLFSMLGAEIFGLDLDEGQLNAFRHRIPYYEGLLGRSLPITLAQADVTKLDRESLGEFDVVFSRGGLGRFMSAAQILDTFGPILRSGGLVIMHNGNPKCLWLDAARIPHSARDASSRADYLAAARSRGYEVLVAEGTSGFPWQAWKFGPVAEEANKLTRPFSRLHLQLDFVLRKP